MNILVFSQSQILRGRELPIAFPFMFFELGYGTNALPQISRSFPTPVACRETTDGDEMQRGINCVWYAWDKRWGWEIGHPSARLFWTPALMLHVAQLLASTWKTSYSGLVCQLCYTELDINLTKERWHGIISTSVNLSCHHNTMRTFDIYNFKWINTKQTKKRILSVTDQSQWNIDSFDQP